MNDFKIENLRVKFLDLTAKEGIEISQSLMSAISFNNSGESTIDMGKFCKESINLIVSKLRIETKDADGKMTFKNVNSIEELALFFKNPLVAFEITSCFFQYLSPFLNSIGGLKDSKMGGFLA